MSAVVTEHDIRRRIVLSVAGEIDIATAPVLAAAVDRALAVGAAELWIDLAATRFSTRRASTCSPRPRPAHASSIGSSW